MHRAAFVDYTRRRCVHELYGPQPIKSGGIAVLRRWTRLKRQKEG